MKTVPRKARRPFRLKKLFLGGLIVILTFWPGGAQQQAPLSPSSPLGPLSSRTGLLLKDAVVSRLIQESSGDLAFDTVSHLALWHRTQASEDYSRAAEWISGKARDFGLERVEIERFPSDGTIEYFGFATPAQWKVNKGELWLTSPNLMKLASFSDLPVSLAGESTSADVEAELVDIRAGTADKDYAAGVKGKIVLTSSQPKAVFDRAVIKEGAAGIVSFNSTTVYDQENRRLGDFPDQVGWTSLPETKGGSSGRFAFNVSSRQGRDLQALIRQGKTVRIHAVVDAEIGPGKLEVVSGIMPGCLYPDEEIVVTAHLDHYKPGANDNASGSAAILEMARTMRRLIDDKELPPPLRTIRFLWVPEYNGTYAWMSKHLNDPVKRLANLNFDMVGENTAKTNSKVVLCTTSDSNPSFLNAVMESILDFVNRFNDDRYPVQPGLFIGSLGGSRNRAAWRMVPYTTGTDHEVFTKLKVGATSLGAWPDDFYHSSEDSPEKVDPTQLHRAVVLGLAGIVTLAYADSDGARDLARLSLIYGRKRIAQSEFSVVRSLLSATKDEFNKAEWLAGDEAASRNKTEDIAQMRAAELGVARSPKPPNEVEKRAARLKPAWNAGRELFPFEYVQRILAEDTAAQIPKIEAALNEADQRLRDQGIDELTLYGFHDAAAMYVDGKRSILDIRNAVAAEYVPIEAEALELYFRAFEKAGLMKIAQRSIR